MSSSPVLFLSHAGVDSEAAVRLAEQIERSPAAQECGLKIWIDRRSLIAGQPWQEQLEHAISRDSTAFAVYLTSAGAESWVRLEIRAALDRVIDERKNNKTYPFVPIIAQDLQDTRRLPPFAQQYQGVSLAEGPAALQKLISVVMNADASQVQLVAEPFRGLGAFGATHAHLFFGRAEDTEKLIGQLRQTSFVLVVGDSGCGKSSLVKAGLVPAFREGCLADPYQPRPDWSLWHVVEMRPSADPVEGLIKAVADAARGVCVNAELLGNAVDRLRKRQPGAFRDTLREGAPANANVLLVVDQFEEFWTQTVDAAVRETFLNAILEASNSNDHALRVVATMRRDYLFQCESHSALRERLHSANGQCKYNVRRMDDARLRQCIEKPLALAGVAAAEAHALADEILRDVGDQPGDLALVEMALFETWQKREPCRRLLDAYIKTGRVQGALPGAADAALIVLGEERASLAEAVFMRLVNQAPDGGVTRRLARKTEFLPDCWLVAQALASVECKRLLVLRGGVEQETRHGMSSGVERTAGEQSEQAQRAAPSRAFGGGTLAGGPDEEAAELAHEQLATQWPRYQTWLREAADDKRSLDRLIDRAQRWVTHGKTWRALASGLDLVEFTRLGESRRVWLSPNELKFVRYSKARGALLRGAAALAMAASLLAAGWIIKDQQRQIVQTQAAGIWNRLELDAPLADRDIQALLQLRAAVPDVKLTVLAMLLHDQGLAERFLRQPELVTRAAIGLDPGLRTRALAQVVSATLPESADSHIKAAVARLGGVLESVEAMEPYFKAIVAATNPVQLKALGVELAELVDKLTADQASRAVEPFLEAIVATTNPQLGALGQGLARLVGKLSADQASRARERFLKLIAATTNPLQLQVLGQGLAGLRAKVTVDQASQAVEPFLKVIAATTDAFQLRVLGQGRAGLVGELTADQASRAVEPFLEAIAATTSPYELEALGQGLAGLRAELTADQASRAAEPFLKAIAATTDAYHLQVLGQALAGLRAELAADQASRAAEPFLKAIAATTNPYQLQALGQGLAGLVGELTAGQASHAMERLRKTIAATTNPYELRALSQGLAGLRAELTAGQASRAVELFLKAIAGASRRYERLKLGQELAGLIGELTPDQALRAVERFLKAIAATTEASQLQALGQGLAGLVGELTADQASRAVEPFLEAIAATTNPFQLQVLAEGLAGLRAGLTANQAQRAAEPFLKALPATTNTFQLQALGVGLAGFRAGLTADQARRAAEPFLNAIAATTDPSQLQPLGQGLTGLRAELTADQASRTAESFLKALAATTNPDQVRSLGQGVAGLVGKLTADQASRAVEPFLKAIASTTDASQLQALSRGLAELVGELTADQASQAVERFINAIAATTNAFQLQALGVGLAGLRAGLTADQARRAAEPFLKGLAATTNTFQLQALGAGLAGLVGRLTADQASRAVAPFLKAIATTTDASQLRALSGGLAGLLSEFQDPVGAVGAVLQALENPFTTGAVTTILLGAIHRGFPTEIAADTGTWQVVDWAQKHR